jgi:excisionase family DNA binding protein
MSVVQDTQSPAVDARREVYHVREMAEILGVKEQFIRNKLAEGVIPGQKLGGVWMSKKTVFDAWLNRHFGEAS